MKEIIEGLEVALNSYEYDGEKEKAAAIKKVIENMEEQLQDIKNASFSEGAAYILDYLEAVYGEGIHLTDVWAEYMGACECHIEEDIE
jgi:hypothetical protein